MTSDAMFIHQPASNGYYFGEEHPFDPIRFKLTVELLQAVGALSQEQIVRPPAGLPNMNELLALVHRADYVNAVTKISEDVLSDESSMLAEQYGLHADETPHFKGMHTAALAIVEGTVAAADAVMQNKTKHAYHIAGGLHHAFPSRGSGFCVYNDAAVAIEHLRRSYDARVLYIDTDVHHGDGVQWVYYADPNVCTYSIHETGKFLYPGTGYVYEKGIDRGFGSCYNMPLEPYTEDDSFLECFETTIRKVIESFKPDIIISNHGCDAHAYDELSHLHCSMRIYHEIPKLIHELAHTYTDGRWVALGGGGYDKWRVVPRAWSLVWLTMIDHPLMQALSDGTNPSLPDSWLQAWQSKSPNPLPLYWMDDMSSILAIPRRQEITERNRVTMSIAIQDL